MGSSPVSSGNIYPRKINLNHLSISNPMLDLLQNQTVIKITKAADKNQYHQWQAALSKYIKSCSNLFLPIKHSFMPTGLCGNSGIIEIYYSNYPYLLSQQIINHQDRKSPFTESDIWFYLYHLMKARFQARQIIGDIRPKNIFTNIEGKIKVPTLVSWPSFYNNKLQMAQDKIVTYLAPQDLKLVSLGALKSRKGQETSQMFSIGLTLLSIVNLKDYEYLYNLKKTSFDIVGLYEAMALCKRKVYLSLILKSIIINLCSEESDLRLTAKQVWSLLSKHQQAINKKMVFTIEGVPNRIYQQVDKLRLSMEANPSQFVQSQMLSRIDGSGIKYPQHLQVHKIVPEYVLDHKAIFLQRFP